MGRHSTALMVGGIILSSVGVASIIGAITVFVGDGNSRGDFKGLASLVIGVPLMVHGLGCLGGGIPMWVIGARDIPLGYAGARPSLVPAVSIGPTSGSLRWDL